MNTKSIVHVADLRDAKMPGACLRQATLPEAILYRADLEGSDLQDASLSKARLFRANLKNANLYNAYLDAADLRCACLEGANICHASLHSVNFRGARLAGARFEDSALSQAVLPDGTRFRDEADLEKFTDKAHPLFRETLAKVEALAEAEPVELPEDNACPCCGQPRMTMSEFVERTYGSLAHDPIERHPPEYVETEDTLE